MKSSFIDRGMLLPLLLVMAGTMEPRAAEATNTNTISDLSLSQALDMAERMHPVLAEVHAQLDAAEGRLNQAGAFPNPEAILRADQLPLDDNDEEEYLAGVAQPIPLGGRRGKARQVAELERDVRQRGLEVVRRDLRKRVQGSFATALYQESAYRAQREILSSATGFVSLTKARVEAGDTVPSELARAEMEQARVRFEVERSQAMRNQAMLRLAAAMGDPSLRVGSLVGSLDSAFEMPSLEALSVDPAFQADVALSEVQLRAMESRIQLVSADRIPDVTVEALYHRLEASEANTVDIGLRIPLPLFNRQQGRLQEARAEAAVAEARLRVTSQQVRLQFEEARNRFSTALASARMLQSELLPRAETVLQSGQLRLEAGDISLAELLPLRRELEAMRLTYLETLRDVLLAWADLSRYAGSAHMSVP